MTKVRNRSIRANCKKCGLKMIVPWSKVANDKTGRNDVFRTI